MLGQTPVYPGGGGGGTGCVPGSTSSILKGNGSGGCGAATPGTDVLTATGQFAASQLVSPITNGLIGEYHFNEASVVSGSTGVDYSGNANNGTYFGSPVVTNTLKGGMVSAGAGGMDLPSAFNTTALTLSTYGCTNAQTTVNNPLYAVMVAGLAGSIAPTISNPQIFGMMLQGTQGSTPLGLSFGKYGLSPTILNQTSVSVATISTQAGETMNGCHLMTWVRGTTHDQFFIDDHEVSFYQYQNAGTAASAPSSGSFGVGMAHYATLPAAGYAFPYPIYYHFDFNRVLTADEIKALSGSVAGAATFRGITKSATTYSDAGNQLITVGDSITYGLNSGTNGWPALLTGLTNNVYSITNISTPGWQLENVITECQTRGQGAINPNMNNTVTIFAGTNDLAQVGGALGTVTPAIAYQRLRRAVQCYKGLTPMPRVFVFTMMSRGVTGGGSSATNDALKNTYNDLIRKDWAGADAGFDIASFVALGADGVAVSGQSTTACLGTACYGGDFVHPTANGQQVTANLFASFINWADAYKNGTNPKLVTASTYTVLSGDTAINANPTSASQTLTLPSAVGLVGTDRYVSNVQATGANTVTIAAASGENIDGASTLVCPNATKCSLRSVLGLTPGTSAADTTSGAHWEQFGFSGGGGGSGNATSIQSVPVSATAPTSSQVLGYNGTNWIPTTVTGGTVPTGTGFYHITSGVTDGAAQAIPTATTSSLGLVQPDGTTITISGGVISSTGGGGTVPTGTGYYTITSGVANPTATSLPIASSSVQGISNCDNITITCSSGILSAVGGAGNATSLQSVAVSATTPTTSQVLTYNGTTWAPATPGASGAGLGVNTFTGAQTVPSVIYNNMTGAGTATVYTLANAAITALTAGTTVAFIPNVNSGTAPTLNVNSLGAVTITKYSGTALFAADMVAGKISVLVYDGTNWVLQNPANIQGSTVTGGTVNFTTTLQRGGQSVHAVNACNNTAMAAAATTAACTVTGASAGSICSVIPVNAAAAALMRGTASITTPLAGNVPFYTPTTNTVTLTFSSAAGVQQAAGGEIFSMMCDL